MSKSIYEETLTELEVWKSTNALDQEQLEKIDIHIEVMKKAVKQEKLLGLYRKLQHCYWEYDDIRQLEIKIQELEIEQLQIKELENE